MARAAVQSAFLLVLHLVAGALMLYVLLDVVPWFRREFEEFDIEPPAPLCFLAAALFALTSPLRTVMHGLAG
ncbi:MAG: hypothetical protein J5I93_22640 [Pirellulaceae bacterium]|nr:hypothetical protein [Pirellulaceae bacterium]